MAFRPAINKTIVTEHGRNKERSEEPLIIFVDNEMLISLPESGIRSAFLGSPLVGMRESIMNSLEYLVPGKLSGFFCKRWS